MPRAVRTRKADATDAVFRALADARRRHIVRLLGAGEMRVTDLAHEFDVSRPAISRHLAVLKRAGLVSVRRAGRERFYALVPGALWEAAGYVRDVEAFWQERFDELDGRLRDGR